MARRILTRDTLSLVALLAVGIIGSGVMRWWLETLGMSTLGTVVFVLGYGAMVIAAWYGWVRPLDISGPGGPAARGEDGESGGSNGSRSR